MNRYTNSLKKAVNEIVQSFRKKGSQKLTSDRDALLIPKTIQLIEFLGLWEKLHNPDFKGVEFDAFMYRAGTNSFVLSPSKWIEATGATGIISKTGNKGGTFAHHDIAFEFASWISAEFKLFLLKEFQRLKKDENNRLKLEWNLQSTISKINYRIHTDAIKENLIPPSPPYTN